MVRFVKRAAKFILISPVLLVVSILNFFFTFVTGLASAVLMVFSFLFGCACLFSLYDHDWFNAGMALVAAWIISPVGLPALAYALCSLLQAASCWLANKMLN